jgi:pimeloyl-ACP methyl ester carboxylesterase
MPYADTNDIATFYEDTGPMGSSPGEPVVLIHGHGADTRLWDYQVPALQAAGYRVVRYDVRGHGKSSVPATGYTWENYAADLGGLLDKSLGIGAIHLVGLSMGGGIALQYALDFPWRAHSLTLVDSTLPGFHYSPEFVADLEALVEAVRREGPGAAFDRLWLSHPMFDGLRRFPDRFALVREMALAYPAADYQEGAIPADYQPQVVDRLAEIRAPALVIVGENDIPDFQLIADIMAANLPQPRKVVLPDCGHVSPLEEPEEFNEALIAFLRAVSAAPWTRRAQRSPRRR